MAVGILLVCSGLSIAFLNQSNTYKLAQSFCWKDVKGVKCRSFLFVLEYLKREK